MDADGPQIEILCDKGCVGFLWNGIEGLALGEKRFAKLRRSAANLLLGSRRQASPWISYHFLQ